VITVDGRTLVGELLSCDQVTNIVLNNTTERIIRPHNDPEPSSEVSHGLYLVRGDNITVCGLVEEELDASIDWSKVVGDPETTSSTSLTALREETLLEAQSMCEVLGKPNATVDPSLSWQIPAQTALHQSPVFSWRSMTGPPTLLKESRLF
jgi:U6 snRNA-associated Sm-like protein LSm8